MTRLHAAALISLASAAVVISACSSPEPATSEPAATEPAAAAPAPAAPAAEPATEAADRPRFMPPVRGRARIGYLKPNIKREGNDIVTTMQVKNLEANPIAGFRVEEFWYDKARNMLPGDQFRMRQPLQPGEVVEVVLRTPRNPNMDTNTYKFSHANGEIDPRQMASFEETGTN